MTKFDEIVVSLAVYSVHGQVYVLNRDTASRLAISSPLEAHKSHAIIFHTCGVDVGFDNPIFAVRFRFCCFWYVCALLCSRIAPFSVECMRASPMVYGAEGS